MFFLPPIDPVIPGIQSYQLWQTARVSRESVASSERPNILEGQPDTKSAVLRDRIKHFGNIINK